MKGENSFCSYGSLICIPISIRKYVMDYYSIIIYFKEVLYLINENFTHLFLFFKI